MFSKEHVKLEKSFNSSGSLFDKLAAKNKTNLKKNKEIDILKSGSEHFKFALEPCYVTERERDLMIKKGKSSSIFNYFR